MIVRLGGGSDPISRMVRGYYDAPVNTTPPALRFVLIFMRFIILSGLNGPFHPVGGNLLKACAWCPLSGACNDGITLGFSRLMQ